MKESHFTVLAVAALIALGIAFYATQLGDDETRGRIVEGLVLHNRRGSDERTAAKGRMSAVGRPLVKHLRSPVGVPGMHKQFRLNDLGEGDRLAWQLRKRSSVIPMCR